MPVKFPFTAIFVIAAASLACVTAFRTQRLPQSSSSSSSDPDQPADDDHEVIASLQRVSDKLQAAHAMNSALAETVRRWIRRQRSSRVGGGKLKGVLDALLAVGGELAEAQTRVQDVAGQLRAELAAGVGILQVRLRDARAEIRSLAAAEAALRSALDAKDLELRGTRTALQGLRAAHVRLITEIQDAARKRDEDEA